LKQNLSHRENRNSLAEQAKNEYLLFIDGDSNIISNNYIQKYISNLLDYDVVYGGRLHPMKCPLDNQKLRWKYGRFIEDKTSEDRKKSPYQSLLFNNTIIKKDIFNKVKFDKTLKKYGHDDTQLSYQLSLLKVKVNHIENPIEHGDIDSNLEYLNKTKESLENLIILYQEGKIDIQFVQLIRLYAFLQKIKSVSFVSNLYSFFEKPIFKNLTGNNPNLLVFNLYRIGYLCKLNSI
jgi:glycosyltransferase involved in cell wall biosynthesis